MNAQHLSPNPYDNMKYLQEYFESLLPAKQAALFMQADIFLSEASLPGDPRS
jgi:hypothetical protein